MIAFEINVETIALSLKIREENPYLWQNNLKIYLKLTSWKEIGNYRGEY